ncbi:rhomboid family intramembrane serine protease [Rhodococcus triatomae]|nr:rhomboid family intramembrane serine protease [Rhodococcus triatomae]QNG25935.1 rhomboid family intramembrane serine protease [Rhodococcus triatomae]
MRKRETDVSGSSDELAEEAAGRGPFGAWRVGGLQASPVTAALVLALWVAAVVSGSVLHGPSHHLAQRVGIGIVPMEHGRVWTLLTAGLWCTGLVAYVAATVLIVAVAMPLERRMGSRRFVLAAVVTQVLGGVLGLGVAALARLVDAGWGFRLHVGVAVGPSTWIVGALMAATADMGTLWRRRIRVGVLALTITLALFGGELQDVVRLAAAVVGLAIGASVVGRSARGDRIVGTRREGRVLVAIVVAASALGPMLAALSPHAAGPLAVLRELFRGAQWTAPEVRALCDAAPTGTDCRQGLLELRLSGVGPTLLALMPSVFVLVLADGLRRGRRFAWIGAVGAQVVLLALALLNFGVRYLDAVSPDSLYYGLADPDVYRTLVPFLAPAAILVVLLATRDLFDVHAPAGTYRRWATATAGFTVVLAALYVAGAWLARAGLDGGPTVPTLIADFPERLVPPVYLQWFEPRFLPTDAVATLLYEWTGVVFWAGLCAGVAWTFLRPAVGADSADAARARSLLQAGSGSPLSWMTTWRGNSYWFTPDGSGYVAYRVIGGVALTTGDPVGRPDRLRDAVVGFAEYAAHNGWVPCFYSVTGQVRRVTDDLGWGGLQVAEETVLDLGSLAFTGKRFQDVRTALNRARKSGISAEWVRFPTAPAAITDQIAAISEEWVADKGMPEMGFTLGGLDELDDPEVRVLVAVDEDRTVHGVTSWLPVYREGVIVGWTLDFMRRRAGEPRGTEVFRPAMEFLIASAAQLLEAEGAEFVSLSGAPLAKVAEPDEPEPAESSELNGARTLSEVLDNVLDLLGRTLEPVYGFRSLLAFKSKFHPRYEAMHMTFPDPAALPSIGSAVGRAYLPHVSMGQGVRLVRTIVSGRVTRT